MNKTALPTGVTEIQVSEWKEKHGRVKLVNLTRENGETVVFIVGRPTREIVDSWSKSNNDGDSKKSRTILQKNCILHGDQALFAKDINLETSVMNKISGMLSELQAEEKEL